MAIPALTKSWSLGIDDEFKFKLRGSKTSQGASACKMSRISVLVYLSFTLTSITKSTSAGMALCCFPH